MSELRPKMRRNKRGGVLTYAGPAYVRPVDRGILLGDMSHDEWDLPYLDQLIERLIGGYGECEIDLTIRATRR